MPSKGRIISRATFRSTQYACTTIRSLAKIIKKKVSPSNFFFSQKLFCGTTSRGEKGSRNIAPPLRYIVYSINRKRYWTDPWPKLTPHKNYVQIDATHIDRLRRAVLSIGNLLNNLDNCTSVVAKPICWSCPHLLTRKYEKLEEYRYT